MRRFVLLVLALPLLSLLAALAVLPALVLALAESAVAQFLLLADHVAELVELRHHVVHVVAVLVRRRHLQIFHHLLKLLQKLLRRVPGAVARHVLETIEHALQIALAQRPRIAIERAGELLTISHLFLHRLQEAIHRGAQLIHELLDFLVGSAAFERLPQRLLGAAQIGLRVGDIAVLDADRHLPKPLGHFTQIVVGLGANERPEDRTEPQIDAGVRGEFLRRQRQRVERGGDERAGVGVERQIAPLLDQRARQRLGEDAFGKPERDRFAGAFVASLVAGDKRHGHFGAGPRMIGEVLDGLPGAAFGARLRQHKRELGWTEQRASGLAFRRRLVLAGESGAGLDDPVIVLDPVGQE